MAGTSLGEQSSTRFAWKSDRVAPLNTKPKIPCFKVGDVVLESRSWRWRGEGDEYKIRSIDWDRGTMAVVRLERGVESGPEQIDPLVQYRRKDQYSSCFLPHHHLGLRKKKNPIFGEEGPGITTQDYTSGPRPLLYDKSQRTPRTLVRG